MVVDDCMMFNVSNIHSVYFKHGVRDFTYTLQLYFSKNLFSITIVFTVCLNYFCNSCRTLT